jgi:uncharacterized glyoxalase superfamily protein PhnB
VFPYPRVSSVARAIELYRDAFGATEKFRSPSRADGSATGG